jgi:acetyl esterase/lipase
MSIGMFLHKLSRPLPRSPDFVRYMETGREESVASIGGGNVRLMFWVPDGYKKVSKDDKAGHFPLVVNFHGGGFTLGSAGDDVRWCIAVAKHVGAVVVSVDYRLAPEYPFPTAVEDGADALLWLVERSEELKLDVTRIAVTGFSSGANMCFTVPLRLQEELLNEMADGEDRRASVIGLERPGMAKALSMGRVLLLKKTRTGGTEATEATGASSSTALDVTSSPEEIEMDDAVNEDEDEDEEEVEDARRKSKDRAARKRRRSFAERMTSSGIPIAIKGVVAWYPPVDYTRTRAQRRETATRIDQQLPQMFTNLFDDSYLQPPTMDMSNPYLSPGVAPRHMLAGLPDDIVIFACEWDMLVDEAKRFRTRLVDELGKQVSFHIVPGVPHGFDKAPNPIRQPPAIWPQYMQACEELKRILK